ncbi:MAG: hypothetical protein ACRC8Y_12080 [Chroococcales cyanobacterium]
MFVVTTSVVIFFMFVVTPSGVINVRSNDFSRYLPPTHPAQLWMNA